MKTNIVKIVAFVAAATLAFSVNAAEKASEASSITGSLSVGFSDQNIYRGADLGDDTLSVSTELRGGIAGLQAFGGLTTDQSIDGGADQYYISAGLASELFGLDVAGGYLHSENVPGGSTEELFAKATANQLLNLTAAVYYELDDELWTAELGVSETIDLDIASLTGRAAVGNTEVTSSDDRTYYVLGADLSKQLAEDVDLVVGVEYTDADDVDDETAVLAGLQVKF